MSDVIDRQIEDIPAHWVGSRICSYVRKRPSLMYCSKPGRYLVTVQTRAAKRDSYTRRRVVCSDHLPKEPAPTVAPSVLGMISAQQAADIIGIEIMTLHQWRRRGKGPRSTKTNGRCWYSRTEVEHFAEALAITNGAAGRLAPLTDGTFIPEEERDTVMNPIYGKPPEGDPIKLLSDAIEVMRPNGEKVVMDLVALADVVISTERALSGVNERLEALSRRVSKLEEKSGRLERAGRILAGGSEYEEPDEDLEERVRALERRVEDENLRIKEGLE